MARTITLIFFASFFTNVVSAQQFGSVVAVDGDQIVVGDGNSPAVPGVV